MVGDVDRAAVYINVAVCVDGIGVALAGFDLDVAAVDDDSRSAVGFALFGSVETVIGTVNVEVAVVDLDVGCLHTLGSVDLE